MADIKDMMRLDRPKDFGLSGNVSTEEYVRRWCAENGLTYEEKVVNRKLRYSRKRLYQRTRKPRG